MCQISELYDLEHTQANAFLERYTYPWQALEEIGALILKLGPTLVDYREVHPGVWIHPTARVAESPSWTPHVSSDRTQRSGTVPLSGEMP